MFFLFCLLGSSLAQDFLLTKAIPSAITIIAAAALPRNPMAVLVAKLSILPEWMLLIVFIVSELIAA